MKIESELTKNGPFNFHFTIMQQCLIFRDSELNGLRQGYMGHLINIANDIASRVESYNLLESFLKTNIPPEVLKKWESLVSAQLAEINEIQAMVLVRHLFFSCHKFKHIMLNNCQSLMP